MKIIELEIKNQRIWLVIELLRVYSPDFKAFTPTGRYICYFKLTEPTQFILGELFKDKRNIPIMFNSEEQAKEYAENYLKDKL
ncbi:hypothetical protein [Draconibacterium orientale]|uniref:hypothetical protein n=1 Tax=Draconibacterium orientale TaxID=1168034 RepID=UPI0029C0DEE9|nr:hypothetical protein [Draconibacterium orientale]